MQIAQVGTAANTILGTLIAGQVAAPRGRAAELEEATLFAWRCENA